MASSGTVKLAVLVQRRILRRIKMKTKEALQLALIPSVMMLCIIYGISWFPSIVIGVGASFLPNVPSVFMEGYRAGKKEWDDPKYKK